jgi:hypothetical protein
MASAWDRTLKEMLASQKITGYALITHQGTAQCAYGSLEDDLSGERAAPMVHQIQSAFTADATPLTSLRALGAQPLIVTARDDVSFLAVSRGNTTALAAQCIKAGIVVVACDGRRLAPNALPAMLTALDALKP